MKLSENDFCYVVTYVFMVLVCEAFAEGYTVEPESYRVVLEDGEIVEPDQVLSFVFKKIG